MRHHLGSTVRIFAIAGLALAFTLATENAQAQQTAAKTTVSTRSAEHGLGFAAYGNVVGSSAAFSYLLQLDELNNLQFLFAIPTTSPLSLGVGAFFKHTVTGTSQIGLHVGGGLGLGSQTSQFFVTISGNLGLHFTIPSLNRIVFAFDAGPTLSIVDGNVGFEMEAYSGSVLGLNIHYLLF